MLPEGLAVVRRRAAGRGQIERLGRPKSGFDLITACTALERIWSAPSWSPAPDPQHRAERTKFLAAPELALGGT